MTRAFLSCTVVLVLATAAAIAPAIAQFPPSPAPATPVPPAGAPPPPPLPRKRPPHRPDRALLAIGAANSHRSTIRPLTNSSSPLGPKGPRRMIPISIAQESLRELASSKSYVFFIEIVTKGGVEKGGRCPDGTITVARKATISL